MTRFKTALGFYLGLAACACLWAQTPSQDDFQKQLLALNNRARLFQLRVEAMARLIQIDPEQAYAAILPLVADPDEERTIRIAASEKMKKIDPVRYLADMANLFEDRDRDYFARQIAIGALAAGNSFGIEKRIRTVMQDRAEDPAIRNYALGLFGRGNAPDKVAVLRLLAQSRTETLAVRNNALFILESLEDRDFVKQEIRSIWARDSESDEFKKNCVLIAERLGDPELMNLLASVVANRRHSPGLKRLALSVLKRAGDASTLEKLKPAYAYESDPGLSADLKDTIEAIQSRAGSADK
jgi:hypothetical protein